MLRNRRGSVLMEFMIVLPIYMLLLGTTFVFGELALQSIHLVGGADRTLAMGTECEDAPDALEMKTLMTAFKKAVSPHAAYDSSGEWNEAATWRTDDEISYDYSGDPSSGEHKSTKFEGKYGAQDGDRRDVLNISENPNEMLQKCLWTKTVAAYVANAYTLTPLTRGFVAFWRWDIDQKRAIMGDTEALSETALSKMLDSGIGRATILGKDLHKRGSETELARQYGYYSIQRNDQARIHGNRYRAADVWALAADENWKILVADEIVAMSDYERVESGGSGGLDKVPDVLTVTKDVPSREFSPELTN